MNTAHIRRVLADIQARVPENLRKNAVKHVKATPTIERVMETALTMDSISQEKKDAIKTFLDKGEFSKMRVVENDRITKLIDQFVSREINKEIKRGNLPSRKQLKKILDEENNNKENKGEDRA